VNTACELLDWEPGTPFHRPLDYPDFPEQSAQRRQLLEFLGR
jgi:hypothetical protein